MQAGSEFVDCMAEPMLTLWLIGILERIHEIVKVAFSVKLVLE